MKDRGEEVPTIRHLENSCSTDFSFLFSVSTTVTDTGTDSAVDGYISTAAAAAAAVITLFPSSLPVNCYLFSVTLSLSVVKHFSNCVSRRQSEGDRVRVTPSLSQCLSADLPALL